MGEVSQPCVISEKGNAEGLLFEGVHALYNFTKLASELMIKEYVRQLRLRDCHKTLCGANLAVAGKVNLGIVFKLLAWNFFNEIFLTSFLLTVPYKYKIFSMVLASFGCKNK